MKGTVCRGLHDSDERVKREREKRTHVQGTAMGSEQGRATKTRQDKHTSPLGHAGQEQTICKPCHVCNPVGPDGHRHGMEG